MTPFNPENKTVLTYKECLQPAMEIVTEEDAQQYFAAYVAFTEQKLKERPRNDSRTAESICRENLGYYSGYYSQEVAERVGRLFHAKHPIFGSAL